METRLVLRVTGGPDAGTTYELDGPSVVGRGAVEFPLSDPSVSRRHVLLRPADGQVQVVDLGSSAGVLVDGQRVSDGASAWPGAVLTMGESTAALLALHAHPAGNAAHRVEHSHDGVHRGISVDRELIIGRESHCDIRVDDRGVSRRHAVLRPTSDGLVVTDLGSSNGTKVNGRRIGSERLLNAGDAVTFATAVDVVSVNSGALAGPAAEEFRVRLETDESQWAVRVRAPVTATVGGVARALAEYLGVATSSKDAWHLYVADDGCLPLATDRWDDVAARRGALLVLVQMKEPIGSCPEHLTGPARITVNAAPRTQSEPADVDVTPPRVPESTSMRGRGLQWQVAGGLVAVLAAVALAVRFPSFAVFAVVGAIAALGTLAFGIIGEQSRRRHQAKLFETGLQALERSLAEGNESQARALRDLSPDLSELKRWVSELSPRLWERRSSDTDALRLRLGTGSRTARWSVPRSDPHQDGESAQRLARVLASFRLLSDVPVTTPADGILGLSGDRRSLLDLVTRMVLEAAVLHAPAALAIWVIAASPDWAWARWLPQLERATGSCLALDAASARSLLDELVQSLSEADGQRMPLERTQRRLVVIGQAALALPETAELLRRWAPSAGLLLALADDPRSLPPECDAVVQLSAAGARIDGGWQDGPSGVFHPDGADLNTATQMALLLGVLRDPRARSASSASLPGVLELAGVGSAADLDLGQVWSRQPRPALCAVFGRDDAGVPAVVDLRRDGPHAMIAGTTGSGKSELLLSLLASLVAVHPPQELALFLIDFKGGATFAALEGLPHVVGMVTDLEGQERLTRRAFTSLEAEISRRKRVLALAGASDIGAYERLRHPGSPPLPSLLVVIDEFALLVTHQPEVKARLDSVATQGRSLGVHLLLATQSPGGVITPAIRANTNVWLCLRVVSESESLELLGRRDAARIPVQAPGRVLMRRGAEDVVLACQTARITTATSGPAGRSPITVEPFADRAPQPLTEEPVTERLGPSELDALVEASRSAVAQGHASGIDALWLPPLPSRVRREDLPESDAALDEVLGVRVGLLDDPVRQSQYAWTVDLASANLMISGVFGSGRSTALRHLISELALSHAPSTLHLYAVDAQGALSDLEQLPHVGAIVQVDDRERLVRLLDRLVRLVEQRRVRRFDPDREPRVVLLLDDYSTFKEVADGVLQGRLNEQLFSLVGHGRSVGVHVVLTCTQLNELRLAMAAQFQARLLLCQSEPADYLALNLRMQVEDLPPDLPGRGCIAGGLEVQVVEPDVASVLATCLPYDGQGGPRAITNLPTEVKLVPDQGTRTKPLARYVYAVGGPENNLVAFDPSRHGPHLLVLGPGQSGRSTTLDTYAHAVLAADPTTRLVVMTRRHGPLDVWNGRPEVACFASDMMQLEAGLEVAEQDPRHTLLVIDDAELLPSAVTDRLERLLREARDSGLLTAIAATTSDWARMFDSWTRYLTGLRTGLLLTPTAEAGHLLDARLPAVVAPMVPGRGFWVDRGEVMLVQVGRMAWAAPPTGSAS